MTRPIALGLAVVTSVALAGCMAARAWSVSDPTLSAMDASVSGSDQHGTLAIADPSPGSRDDGPEIWIDAESGERLIRRRSPIADDGTWTVTTAPESGDAGSRVTLSREDHPGGEGFLIRLHRVEDLDSGRAIVFAPPLLAVGSPLERGAVETESGEGSLEGLGSGPVSAEVSFVGEGTIETGQGAATGLLVKTETEMEFGPALVWREVVVLYGRGPGAEDGSPPVPIAEAVRQRTKVGPITVDSSNDVLVRAGAVEQSG
ncbi:MAG: hypothetical protein AAGG07_09050 [Planctomycetota bacterium]